MLAAASCSSSATALRTVSRFSSAAAPSSHDVFLSFRGKETRKNLVSHLDDALRRHQIKVYKDDTSLKKGDMVWPALVDAIESSKISMVVFSKNYASSTWCLRELTHILKCKKTVIPVFYGIEPSDVGKQTGSYEKAFQKHEKNPKISKETLDDWRAALKIAAKISGFHSKEYRNDCQLIEDIVKDVRQKLEHIVSPIDPKGLVGIDNDCASIKLTLRESQTIRVWRMGSIRKTSIATVSFKNYSSRYEGHRFLDNVRESSGKLEFGRLRGLFKKLYCELFKGDNTDVDPESDAVCRRLQCMIVLLCLMMWILQSKLSIY